MIKGMIQYRLVVLMETATRKKDRIIISHLLQDTINNQHLSRGLLDSLTMEYPDRLITEIYEYNQGLRESFKGLRVV